MFTLFNNFHHAMDTNAIAFVHPLSIATQSTTICGVQIKFRICPVHTHIPATTPRCRPSSITRRRAQILATVTPASPSSSSENPERNDDEATASESKEEAEAEENEDQQPKSDSTADPFEKAQQTIQASINNAFNTFFNPIRAACPILSSSWKSTYGNYILYPPSTTPKSVIHFIGGAFFGAVPHHLYHSFLSRLCSRGHVIVATPYDLSFDYLPIADSISRSWESIEADLAFQYGPLPVFGVGHSAGSVFHALIASLFDDVAPKAGNILISYNCRSADDAIPNYSDLIIPIAKNTINIEKSLPDDVRNNLKNLSTNLDSFISENIFTPSIIKDEVLPISQQSRQFINQIYPLLNEIADSDTDETSTTTDPQNTQHVSQNRSKTKSGQKEFYPSPNEIQAAIQKLYSVSETLLVTFTNDTLDDTPQLAEGLQKNDGANHSVVELSGSHLTPLAQDAPDFAAASAELPYGLGNVVGGPGIVGAVSGVLSEVVASLGVGDLGKLEVVINEWIEAGIDSGKF